MRTIAYIIAVYFGLWLCSWLPAPDYNNPTLAPMLISLFVKLSLIGGSVWLTSKLLGLRRRTPRA